MKPSPKISETFRRKIESLGSTETMTAIVTLSADLPLRGQRLTEREKPKRRNEVVARTAPMIQRLTSDIEAAGGHVLKTQPILQTVIVQGGQKFFEWLADNEGVKALMEDQAIRTVAHGGGSGLKR